MDVEGQPRGSSCKVTQSRERRGRTGSDRHAGHEVVANRPEERLELERVRGEAVDAERGRDRERQERHPLDVVEQRRQRHGRQDRLLVERGLDVVVGHAQVGRLGRRLGLGQGGDERVWTVGRGDRARSRSGGGWRRRRERGRQKGQRRSAQAPVARDASTAAQKARGREKGRVETHLRGRQPSGGAREAG